MDNYRVKIKKSLGLVIGLMLFMPSVIFVLNKSFGEYAVDGMSTGFLLGLLTAFEGLMLYLVITCSRALRNDERLKKLYINSNDERKEYIKKKMAMNTIITFILLMYVAIIIAGYKNAVVFETLVYTLNVFVVVLAVNKLILMKKH